MKSLDATTINKLLLEEHKEEDQVQRSRDAMYRHGFDRAFLFLLSMNYENLFEPWPSKEVTVRYGDGWWFKCKGCGRMVKRIGRESHHEWHKRELNG